MQREGQLSGRGSRHETTSSGSGLRRLVARDAQRIPELRNRRIPRRSHGKPRGFSESQTGPQFRHAQRAPTESRERSDEPTDLARDRPRRAATLRQGVGDERNSTPATRLGCRLGNHGHLRVPRRVDVACGLALAGPGPDQHAASRAVRRRVRPHDRVHARDAIARLTFRHNPSAPRAQMVESPRGRTRSHPCRRAGARRDRHGHPDVDHVTGSGDVLRLGRRPDGLVWPVHAAARFLISTGIPATARGVSELHRTDSVGGLPSGGSTPRLPRRSAVILPTP